MTNVMTKNSFNFIPQTFDEAMNYCNMVANSNFCPREYKGKPDEVFVAMQHGAELGLKALQALQSIAVINGKPGIYGDAALALVKIQPDFEWIKEYEENGTAICIVKRKGEEPHTKKFSVEDAKKAGLYGKQGPWTQYESRMKQFRARGFALRDTFPHVLKGLALAEELQDYPSEKSMGEAQVVNEEQCRTDLLKTQLGISAPPPLAMSPLVESLNSLIASAKTQEELKNAAEEIKQIEIDEESKKKLKENYRLKSLELKKESPEHMSKIFEKNIKNDKV